METSTISASEARKNWSEVLSRVEAGESINITRNDRSIATIVPINSRLYSSPAWQRAMQYQRQVDEIEYTTTVKPALDPDYADELIAAIREDRDENDKCINSDEYVTEVNE